MSKIGEKVRCHRRDLKVLGDCLVGFEGYIYNQLEYNGNTFYEVRATNKGPLVKTASGREKNVYAWQEGNHASFKENELTLIPH